MTSKRSSKKKASKKKTTKKKVAKKKVNKKRTAKKTATKKTVKKKKVSKKKVSKKKPTTKKTTPVKRKYQRRVPKVEYHGRQLNPENFIDRENSWLEFNTRVLSEAADKRLPLFERLKFCEIFRSNLDEYIMKRLGALMNIKDQRIPYHSMDGLDIDLKYSELKKTIQSQTKKLKKIFEQDINGELEKEGIKLINWSEANINEKKYLRKYFKDNIYPVLTPLTVDLGHPFPFISNLSKSLGISYRKPKRKELHFARVKIPQNIPQWVLTCDEKEAKRRKILRFINIEEIISCNLDSLFKGMKIVNHTLFRITRNAEYEADEQEHDDLMEIIEESLKERKFAPCVRVEIPADADDWIRSYILNELSLDEEDCYELITLPQYTGFREITSLPLDHLKIKRFKPVIPLEMKSVFQVDISIFNAIRTRDIMVHHPYESYDKSVVEFIKQAAIDPKVMAIKMTLYRTDSGGRIIDYLIKAAENGKQIVVIIELKARFDEKSNIKWAQKLEDIGIHVTYGFLKKKTHSKLALVIRKDDDRIRAYTHVGTGNYNPQTSKIYEDLSLFTCQKKITSEVIEVFNHLTGQSIVKGFENMLIAPFNMKSKFISLIDQEIKNKKRRLPARIIAKMNQIEDADVIEKLYEASKAGVDITLIVRGFSCLRPGIKGLSENIKVISVIGKYLEHSRIFHFAGGRKEMENGHFYIGSADWMYRNLENRVESICPVSDKKHKKKLSFLMQSLIDEKRQTWDANPDGTYKRRCPKEDISGLHEDLEKYYK